jgi:hypothetical protein
MSTGSQAEQRDRGNEYYPEFDRLHDNIWQFCIGNPDFNSETDAISWMKQLLEITYENSSSSGWYAANILLDYFAPSFSAEHVIEMRSYVRELEKQVSYQEAESR